LVLDGRIGFGGLRTLHGGNSGQEVFRGIVVEFFLLALLVVVEVLGVGVEPACFAIIDSFLVLLAHLAHLSASLAGWSCWGLVYSIVTHLVGLTLLGRERLLGRYDVLVQVPSCCDDLLAILVEIHVLSVGHVMPVVPIGQILFDLLA